MYCGALKKNLKLCLVQELRHWTSIVHAHGLHREHKVCTVCTECQVCTCLHIECQMCTLDNLLKKYIILSFLCAHLCEIFVFETTSIQKRFFQLFSYALEQGACVARIKKNQKNWISFVAYPVCTVCTWCAHGVHCVLYMMCTWCAPNVHSVHSVHTVHIMHLFQQNAIVGHILH